MRTEEEAMPSSPGRELRSKKNPKCTRLKKDSAKRGKNIQKSRTQKPAAKRKAASTWGSESKFSIGKKGGGRERKLIRKRLKIYVDLRKKSVDAGRGVSRSRA